MPIPGFPWRKPSVKRVQVTNSTEISRELADVLATAAPFACDVAREAGAILRRYQEEGFAIQHKGTVDLVTDADKASEELISRRIRAAYPDHRLIGEEGARGTAAAAGAPFGWVVDPLDGTTNFAHRYPHFAVSICLEYQGDPVLGVVFDPMKDELFVGIKGGGATVNGVPLRVSTTSELQQSLLATGFSYNVNERRDAYAWWTAFNNVTQGVRRDGSAALNMCYVAAGRLDGFYERPINAWDVGAGVVIVREAGGTVVGLEAGGYQLYANEVLASNGVLEAPIRALINETKKQAA